MKTIQENFDHMIKMMHGDESLPDYQYREMQIAFFSGFIVGYGFLENEDMNEREQVFWMHQAQTEMKEFMAGLGNE